LANHQMKKISAALIASFVVSILSSGGTIAAAASKVDAAAHSASSTSYQEAKVTINGKLQTFDQSALIIGGSTMVPMRAIFERLGAKIEWDQSTQTVTGTKGSTIIKLTIGQINAYVNGSKITLAAKAQVINGSTLVPLRFVSEALGAKVDWNAKTSTATIISQGAEKPGASQIVNGIKVQYGKHDYGSANQAEYDKVMEIVNQALKGVNDIQFDGGGKYEQQYKDYLNGDRASNYQQNSLEYRGLTIVNTEFSPLVDAGVNNQTIEMMYKASYLAGTLIAGLRDPGDGSPSSAYDALVRKVSDCDSDAQVYSAVYDSLGFNTAVIAGTGHADAIVNVGNTWFKVIGGTFMKVNVSKALANGSYIHTQPTNGTTLSKGNSQGVGADSGSGEADTGSGKIVNGIKVQYGKHTYGSSDQYEYNKVMNVISKKVATYSSVRFDGGGVYEQYFKDFLNGARWSGDKSERTERNMGLYNAELKIGPLVNAGVSNAQAEKAYKSALMAADLISGIKDPGDGSPSSAYDALFRGITDCDSDAQVYSAVFDSMGFNTMVLAGTGHADMMVKLGDNWWKATGATFMKVDVSQALAKGSYIHTQPTDGTTISK